MNETAESNEGNGGAPKHGQGLRNLVETRHKQLEVALKLIDKDQELGTRSDIETALGALKALLTGDLDHIPDVVAAELSQWIETSKYLGARETRRIAELKLAKAVAVEKAAAEKAAAEQSREAEEVVK